MQEGRRIEIEGTVQGVGFRPWVFRLAREEGVCGRVLNDGCGVSIDAYGQAEVLDLFCFRLERELPPTAQILSLDWRPLPVPAEPPASFDIVPSSTAAVEKRFSIPPDLATCADCEREVLAAGDRRYRYPFTNCTHCGPRFTIALGVPYDRPLTTMAEFQMCPACRQEYDDPLDRRFHAQPNACPVCGPRLELRDGEGRRLPVEDPLRSAARELRRGEVVAIKGIGGFHLACDATSEAAVRRLRERKRRESKPFAVMVRDIGMARSYGLLDQAEERLLVSPERPIVLVCRRPEGRLAPSTAPDVSLVGLFLPYSPLHHLLLEEAGRPLVMTSGNLSDEPIAYRDDEALQRLGGVATFFLLHDREIAHRCDDSVARVVDGGPVLLRRSRGFVPRPIVLRQALREPVLACGAHLKNTFCIGIGDRAYLGPHVGDLETVETYDALGEAIEHLERFLGVEPEVIAHDLHPDYLSTRYALSREGTKVGVQHHHAHLASAVAEHRLAGPVVGVIYDGTGWGPDGTAWGGEILMGEAGRYERAATFRGLPLAGGERAIRDVWRLALALLDDAFDGRPPLDRLELFAGTAAGEVELVRQMVERGVATPRGRGVGRYFDAVGALVLQRPQARYEGDVAMALGEIAVTGSDPYPFRIDRSSEPWEIDPRPLVRGLVEDLLAGSPPGVVSSRFHAALAAATADVVLSRDELRELPVVLSGGCFVNRVLTDELLRRLRPSRSVYLQRSVPPGDGGIALGQVLVADAARRA